MDEKRRMWMQAAVGACVYSIFKASANIQEESNGLVSVKDCGAFGDGIHDDSKALLIADLTGQRVIYPPGRYLYKSNNNLLFRGGVKFYNASVNGKRDGIVVFDDDDRLIGLQHNHLEQDYAKMKGLPVTCGYIVPAPEASFAKLNSVDFVAHWYNDFGLESTRVAKGKNGSLTWYYWDWAFNANNYDARRQPLLGWYRGDDLRVLDWQCYWLLKYGICGVNLTGVIDFSLWSWPGHKDYWKYRLFNEVKNFKKLSCICWGRVNGSVQDILSQWSSIFEIYKKHGKSYMFEKRNDAVLYIFDGGELHRAHSRQENNKLDFYERAVLAAKKHGFSGLTLLVRKPERNFEKMRSKLADIGVTYLAAGYSDIDGATGEDYKGLVNTWSPPPKGYIANIATAKESCFPHPSRWNWKGSTPDLFEKLLKRVADWAAQSPDSNGLVQIYNVSEWAEGGPGLQPNMKDRFGYLNAVKRVALSL